MPPTSKPVSDPEGRTALREIDQFEKKQVQKKPNRYPKASLEQHLSLDETMSKRIKMRAQISKE